MLQGLSLGVGEKQGYSALSAHMDTGHAIRQDTNTHPTNSKIPCEQNCLLCPWIMDMPKW